MPRKSETRVVNPREKSQGKTPTKRPMGANNDATQSTLFVNSVEKAMRILRVFDARRPQLMLSEIAQLADLDLSAAQRFTYTLVELGYLVKKPQGRTYALSVRLLDFGYHYLASSDLVQRATPHLQALSRETGETTNITVLDGADVVFVQRMVSMHVLAPSVVVGSRLPAYCTAPGLAMLSLLSNDEVDEILSQSDLVRHTASTIVEPSRIRARLRQARASGYAHTEDEYYIGDISTAVAIQGQDGRPEGAVNVAISRSRWQGKEHEAKVASLLIMAARAIAR